MGGDQSRAETFVREGGVHVVVDQPIAVAGQPLTGRVFLHLIHDLDKHYDDRLLLTFKGTQITYWEQSSHRYGEDDCSSDDDDITFQSKKTICNMDMKLCQPNASEYPAGQYEFPFTFEIPIDLPHSFYQELDNGYCEISYHVEVHLQRSDWTLASLKHSGSVQVHAPLEVPMPRPAFDKKRLPLRKCYCFNRGHVNVSWELKSDRCWRSVFGKVQDLLDGENHFLEIDLSLQNETNEALKSVKVVLQKVITYVAFKPRHADGVQRIDLVSVTLKPPGPYQELKRQLHLDLHGVEEKLDPTFSTELMSVDYVLRCLVDVPAASDLELSHPIQVYEFDPKECTPLENPPPSPKIKKRPITPAQVSRGAPKKPPGKLPTGTIGHFEAMISAGKTDKPRMEESDEEEMVRLLSEQSVENGSGSALIPPPIVDTDSQYIMPPIPDQEQAIINTTIHHEVSPNVEPPAYAELPDHPEWQPKIVVN